MNGFYGNLNNLTNRMAGLLIENKDFLKYLYYTNDEPLNNPDVENPLEQVLNKKFFLQPKPSSPTTEEGVIVEMFLSGDNPENANGGMFTDYVITFNVLCHLGTWGIKGGIRPYMIMGMIDSTFNNKNIKEISFSKIRPLGSKYMQFENGWQGYKLAYVLSWNGNTMC